MSILGDNPNIYKDMNIVMYGSFINSIYNKSDIQRHKVFSYLSMRVVLSPQFWSGHDRLKNSISLRGYGLDNGAYIDYNKGTEFNGDKFLKMCKELGNGADRIAIPDVVGDSKKTLELARDWIDKLEKLNLNTMLLIVWQDGMTREDLLPFVKDGYGIFIGGTTEAKLVNIPMISKLCREYNVWCHVGRVNTLNRLKYCIKHKVHSIDGSGYTRFLTHNKKFLQHFLFLKKQISLFPNEKLDFSKIKTFNQRIKYFGIDETIYDEMFEKNTDYVGLGKNDSKTDYPFFKWDRQYFISYK